jgi:hypothetical protein
MQIDFPSVKIESGTNKTFIYLLKLSFMPSEYYFKQEFKSSNTTCCHRNTPKLVVLFFGD